MEIKAVITFLLITVILASCSSATTPVSIPTTLPTPVFTTIPTATLTVVPATPKPTAPSPITFSGEGNAYLTINKWRGPALIHIDYMGTDKFNAWNLSEKESLLNFALFTDGGYSGTQVLDFSDHLSFQTYFLEIYTTGNWEIEILPFEQGRRANVPSVFTGKKQRCYFS